MQGKQVVAFFNIANRPVNNVIASDKLMAGSEKLSVEDKIKRLKGMRVAMPSAGGSGEKMLGVLAKKYGLTLPGDITSVYLGAEAPSYVAAFQRDLIDAALPFEPAGVLVQQAGKGKIYLNMMNGEVPEVRDILFMVLATHPDNIKEKPEVLRKVAAAITDAVKILKGDPKRGKALMALEYPSMTAETNEQAYDIVSQIWTKDGKMTEAQARATFAYLQPSGPAAGEFSVDLHQRFSAEVVSPACPPDACFGVLDGLTETGSIGLRARHVVRALIGPPRIQGHEYVSRSLRFSPRKWGHFSSRDSLCVVTFTNSREIGRSVSGAQNSVSRN